MSRKNGDINTSAEIVGGCLGVLLSLAFWGAVIFVALHFIVKYW